MSGKSGSRLPDGGEGDRRASSRTSRCADGRASSRSPSRSTTQSVAPRGLSTRRRRDAGSRPRARRRADGSSGPVEQRRRGGRSDWRELEVRCSSRALHVAGRRGSGRPGTKSVVREARAGRSRRPSATPAARAAGPDGAEPSRVVARERRRRPASRSWNERVEQELAPAGRRVAREARELRAARRAIASASSVERAAADARPCRTGSGAR